MKEKPSYKNNSSNTQKNPGVLICWIQGLVFRATLKESGTNYFTNEKKHGHATLRAMTHGSGPLEHACSTSDTVAICGHTPSTGTFLATALGGRTPLILTGHMKDCMLEQPTCPSMPSQYT